MWEELSWDKRQKFKSLLWLLQDYQESAFFIAEDCWLFVSPNSWEHFVAKYNSSKFNQLMEKGYLKYFDYEYFWLECFPDFELGLMFFLDCTLH